MHDNFERDINYLRVSITDRCNLRCTYCMPIEGVKSTPHEEILRLEEIERVIRAAALVGIRKIRLTGGEPLVRKGLLDLVCSIAAVPGIDDIAITTNGTLLAGQARELKEAGLSRVNISLDTLQKWRYHQITRCGNIEDVWRGIEAALEAGLEPVKLNTVVIRGFNDDEILDLARLSLDRPLHVRFIELMPIGTSNDWARDRYIPAREIKETVEAGLGILQDVHKLTGSGPAKYHRLPGAVGTIGFISAVSDHFCRRCNRLRLTSQGTLRPCLYSKNEIDVKGALRTGAEEMELARLVMQAAKCKPDRHNIDAGWQDENRVMSQIGG